MRLNASLYIVSSLLWTLVFLGLSPLASAQGVRLHAEIEPGWSSQYMVNAQMELVAREEVIDRLEQKFTLRLIVVAQEEGEDGAPAAMLRATIEHLDVRHTSGQDTVQTVIPRPEGEPAHDESPPLERIYRALAESVLEFEVLPSGRIRLISGLDTALSAAEAVEPRNPARFLGILAPGAAERTIRSIITLDPQQGQRRPGESWRDEQTVPIVGRHAEVLTEYTLDSLDDAVAHVRGRTTVTLEEADPAPTQPQLVIAEQSGEVRARWDTRAGRLVARTSETRIVWQATLRTDPPIESQTTATSRQEITLQPGPPQSR